MEKWWSAKEALPLVAMITVAFAQVGLVTLSKTAMKSGLNPYVFIVYYDALGTIILLPWFLCRCLRGLSYSTITLGAAIGNLCPIFTCLLAVSLRMEKLDLRRLNDEIKVSGMIVAVVGALVVTLYKGPALLMPQHSSSSTAALHTQQSNWSLGCLFFLLGYLLISLWSILQADTAKSYPDEVSIVFFTTLFGTIETAAAALLLVEDQSAWKLHHQIDIISILYAGFSISVFTCTVDTWCLRKKGAIYVSMFSPLKVALACFIGFVFLDDGIYLGSLIGSTTIIVGFYAVIWAQAKTKNDLVKNDAHIGGLESASTHVTPLLQS